MATLYEISTNIREVIENGFATDDDGVITFDESDLESLQEDLKDKLEACALMLKNWNADATAIKAEEDALKGRRQTLSNKIENLQKYMTTCMQFNGIPKLETSKARVSFRKSEAVTITNEEVIPQEYIKTTITMKPSLSDIKKAIKDGNDVPGAHLEVKQNIQIK